MFLFMRVMLRYIEDIRIGSDERLKTCFQREIKIVNIVWKSEEVAMLLWGNNAFANAQ